MHCTTLPTYMRGLLLFMLVALVLTGIPTPRVTAQVGGPTVQPTPLANARPDACEPNDRIDQACALPLNAVSGPFTFVPEGDRDVYSLNLGAEPDGLETVISVRGTEGLDLLTTLTRAGSGEPLATIASPAISTTLTTDVRGWVVLQVENRAPGIAVGQSYRIEARTVIPPPPPPPPSGPEGMARPAAEPDALENNWSPETAAPIGVGVLYELNFVCPVLDGCPGGDHDYLRFEAKAGLRYLIATFDLAPGVDTVLDLFWQAADGQWTLLATNDDARPGHALLSVLRWQAPGDGAVLVRVAPRDGGLAPVLTGREPVPTYRFAVALGASPLAAQLEDRIADQTGTPRPSVVSIEPSPAPAPAPVDPPPSEGTGSTTPPPAPTAAPITSGVPAGTEGFFVEPALVHVAPDASSAVLATMGIDSVATLTGMVSGLFVEVTSSSFVGPGWVDRRAVRPLAPQASAAPTDQAPEGGSSAPAPTAAPSGASTNGTVPEANRGQQPSGLVVRTLPLLPLPPLAVEPPPVPVEVLVTVTTTQGVGVVGVRLVLSNIFGDRYVEAITDANGRAVLTTVVPPGAALRLLIPALGLTHSVSGDRAQVSVTIPEVQP